MKASINFAKPVRPIGKLNGMNNGPIHCFTDRTKEYKDMGVDFIRFHETHSFFTKCVEIPFIFRDFDADENDPKNYYFAETDAVLKGAVDLGAEILYRLGMGTEGTKPRVFLSIPKDYEKWARIAEHIVAHYTEGWADGFYYGDNLKILEIWNEADLVQYWPAENWPEGRSSFIDFYETTASYLKKRFPHMMIGPCGWADIYAEKKPEEEKKRISYEHRYDFFHALLSRVKEHRVPMDYFAWHMYSTNSAHREERCRIIRGLLEEFGMQDLPLFNTEWRNLSVKWDSKRYWCYDRTYPALNTVSTAAGMIVMQHYGNTRAAYYDSDERSKFCGLYDFNGDPLPDYYPMKAWKWVREGKTEVAVEGETSDFRLCASRDGKKAVALLTNEGEEKKIALSLSGLPAAGYDLYLFDQCRKLEKIRSGRFTGRALSLTLPKESFILIRFC